ncbi:MAG: hypothetical protein KBG28_29885 [Kofleriaceae bacterium]|jgi:hypothetical protein|nr:hypothetical protein [Kofleriaceae bacterium]MBP6837972.1 hypothetical protein [Kofleriaceae bacterium]MBP9208217.1 hypothetical protein [Kofleriaceae bacterium]
MKPELLLELLESAAEQLAIKVSYESLGASVGNGGLCRVKGEFRVIIDKRATPQERVATLASAIASFDITELELPEKVREVIRFHEGSARIKVKPASAATAAAPTSSGAPVAAASAVPSSKLGAA